jgi:hypothetical protein
LGQKVEGMKGDVIHINDEGKTISIGYVYFLQAKETQYVKIGFTSHSLQQRIAALQCGCPFKLVLLFAVCVKDPAALEKRLQRKLSPYRLYGEWFVLPPNMLASLELFTSLLLGPEKILETQTLDVPSTSSTEDSILMALHDGPKTLSGIMTILGQDTTRDYTRLRKQIYRMTLRGLVIKQSHGLYQLTTAEDKAPTAIG